MGFLDFCRQQAENRATQARQLAASTLVLIKDTITRISASDVKYISISSLSSPFSLLSAYRAENSSLHGLTCPYFRRGDYTASFSYLLRSRESIFLDWFVHDPFYREQYISRSSRASLLGVYSSHKEQRKYLLSLFKHLGFFGFSFFYLGFDRIFLFVILFWQCFGFALCKLFQGVFHCISLSFPLPTLPSSSLSYSQVLDTITLLECSNVQAMCAPASSSSTVQEHNVTAPTSQPGGVTGIAERWRRQRAQERNVREQAQRLSEPGVGATSATPSFEQAGRAYLLADGARATDSSLLPRRGNIYGSRVMGIPRLARSVDVRSLRTLMTNAGAIRASDGGILVNFNPCPEEEMEAQRDMGNNSYHLDLVEIFIDPSGMGGDDTDLSVVATWGGDTEFTRAWLGTVATFLGNGSSGSVMGPGVRIFYESANHHRDLQLRIGSTNTTRDTDQILAGIYVGTMRQHTGPAQELRHVISNTIVRDQEQGRVIRSQQLGNTWVLSPTGGFVPGVPEVRMRLQGNSVLEMIDPLTYRAVSTPDQWFTVQGNRGGRLNRSMSNFVSLPRQEAARRSIDNLLHSQIQGEPRDMLNEPRTGNAAGLSDPAEILFSTSFMVPKDAKVGSLLSVFNILSESAAFSSQLYSEWFAGNLFLGDLCLVCEAPPSSYSGLALLFTFDFYERLDEKPSTLPLAVGKHFPHTVHILRNGDRHVFNLSFKEHFGHALHSRGTGFCVPRVFVSVATGNQVEAFDTWKCTVNFSCRRESFGSLFDLGAVATWPPSRDIAFNRFIGPYVIESGTAAKDLEISLSLGGGSTWSGGSIISFPSACFSVFQGQVGSIKFVLEPTCSIFCTAKFLCVLVFGSFVPTTAQMWKMKHAVVTGGEVVELPFDVPFGTIPTMSLAGAHLIYRPIGGVMAPKDFPGKYEFLVHIIDVTRGEAEFRTFSSTDDYMAWFTCTNITVDDFTLEIPSRLTDFSTKEATFTMYNNGFSQMVGASGFHQGEVELEFSWSLNSSFSEAKGWISISTLYGTPSANFRGHYSVSNCVMPNKRVVRFSIGTFAGGVTANFKGFDTNSVKFHTNIGKYLSSLCVSVRPLPGFKFFGKSAIIRKSASSSSAG
uniref:Polyprotein n=1 Tax=Asian lizard's tail nepovirus TaxID=3115763 RepID=A0AAT9JB62_9SECO